MGAETWTTYEKDGRRHVDQDKSEASERGEWKGFKCAVLHSTTKVLRMLAHFREFLAYAYHFWRPLKTWWNSATRSPRNGYIPDYTRVPFLVGYSARLLFRLGVIIAQSNLVGWIQRCVAR